MISLNECLTKCRHYGIVPVPAIEGMGMADHSIRNPCFGYQHVGFQDGSVTGGELVRRHARRSHDPTLPVALGTVTSEKTTKRNGLTTDERLPVKMLNDRILVRHGDAEGERRSSGGILIPATAQVGKRLTWAEVVAAGPNVRSMEPGDQVLFNPDDRYEVEVRGTDYIILRERDVHAVAAERLDEGSTGLYL